jgi:hypothetical protein
LQAPFFANGEDVAMPVRGYQWAERGSVSSMKNNLVRFPKLPDPHPEPGSDFERHHFVFEAPGRRVALDLFARVVDLTAKPPDPARTEPAPSPAAQKRRTRGKPRG